MLLQQRPPPLLFSSKIMGNQRARMFLVLQKNGPVTRDTDLHILSSWKKSLFSPFADAR
jgi:hypothetical protein